MTQQAVVDANADDEIDISKWKVVARGASAMKERKLTLAVLRRARGLTQEQLAKRAKLTQSEISRAELRDNCLVSTLSRYAKALGGELRLFVEIDGRRYPISP